MILAKFSQSRNDMYWSIFADGGDGTIRWVGYDDRYWWDNVSVAEHTRRRVGPKTGRIFMIEFDTKVVTIFPPDGTL